MKALRVTDADVVNWPSIEVRRRPEGWCDLVLHGSASELARESGIADLTLSMSHETEFATATVVGTRCGRSTRIAQ